MQYAAEPFAPSPRAARYCCTKMVRVSACPGASSAASARFSASRPKELGQERHVSRVRATAETASGCHPVAGPCVTALPRGREETESKRWSTGLVLSASGCCDEKQTRASVRNTMYIPCNARTRLSLAARECTLLRWLSGDGRIYFSFISSFFSSSFSRFNSKDGHTPVPLTSSVCPRAYLSIKSFEKFHGGFEMDAVRGNLLLLQEKNLLKKAWCKQMIAYRCPFDFGFGRRPERGDPSESSAVLMVQKMNIFGSPARPARPARPAQRSPACTAEQVQPTVQ